MLLSLQDDNIHTCYNPGVPRYIKRFLKFRQSAFTNPDSYFKHYANLSEQEAIETASNIWDNINGLNLKQNILPTRERANLILRKGENHEVELVKLRK